MESKPTRISEYSLNRIREIGGKVGEPSDDTAIRHVLAEYDRLMVENELLKKKLEGCEKKMLKKKPECMKK